jgi:dihydroorotase-like cyclic amidohydrolase
MNQEIVFLEGFIDPHVHCRDNEEAHKETYAPQHEPQ